ncbi:GNAT family N-acetyltransferase [Streptomyces sp. V1I1]|uniref:GNAT family N-acetyltransferase n=1 Tax=Streptomyces sp. V1I1 TaxID=3042272 RepID=UPI002786D3D3|nr:GNAT family N-acetyltransferase [Streptomyces sp. V1I1]MDQ0945802.1 hypothetical protein [Streptomyces sp. V1I1]
MFIESLVPVDGALPGAVLTEITELYRSNRDFLALSGYFPDPDDVRIEQVATELARKLATPDAEVLLARGGGRLVALADTLARHPGPHRPRPLDRAADGGRPRATLRIRTPVGATRRGTVPGRGPYRRQARRVENNPRALAFWTALGYLVIGHREDRQLGRPCAVLYKSLKSAG